MAVLISNQSGNFTTASTWSIVDSTSYLNTEVGSTSLTTAFVSSAAFTPGAIIIDGITIKIASRSLSPSGTFSVRLAQGGLAVVGTTVTINVSDIPSVLGQTNVGWFFLKFASPVTLVAATAYTVQASTSVASMVTLYRSATVGDWTRAVRTTTTQAPLATDEMIIIGEFVSSGVNSQFTVLMNNTTSVTTFGAVTICARGILNWDTTISTYLKIAGFMTIYTDGIYQQGTPSVPIDTSVTSKLQFSLISNVQFGIEVRIGGTFTSAGTPLANYTAMLTADAAASATSLTTSISTGWKSGDLIAISSTTRTRTECESKTLTGDASDTTLPISAITSAHSGTGAIAATLLNLTRNVQIFGTSTTLQSYMSVSSSCTVNMQWTEIYNFGSATSFRRGIDIVNSTGSVTINGCSIRDGISTNSLGIFAQGLTTGTNTFTNTVMYNIASNGFTQSVITGTSTIMTNLYVMLSGTTCISIADLGGTISNLYAAGGATGGIFLTENLSVNAGTMSGFTAHSNLGAGLALQTLSSFGNNPGAVISNVNSWRNVNGVTCAGVFDFSIENLITFGNQTANINFLTNPSANINLTSLTVNSGATLTCPIGIGFTVSCLNLVVESGTFGATTTHATGDITVISARTFVTGNFRNCLFSSTTQFANSSTNTTESSVFTSAKHQQTAGNHRTVRKFGIITADTTIFNFESPSQRLTPNTSGQKLKSGLLKFSVPNGLTATVQVYVRKSVAGDGSAYNGTQPRFILQKNTAVGISSDQVLATCTVAADGAFELLTATTPAITDNASFSVYIDCEGTAGWVNVDNFRVEVI